MEVRKARARDVHAGALNGFGPLKNTPGKFSVLDASSPKRCVVFKQSCDSVNSRNATSHIQHMHVRTNTLSPLDIASSMNWNIGSENSKMK